MPIKRLHPPFDRAEELDHAQGETGVVLVRLDLDRVAKHPLGLGELPLVEQVLKRDPTRLGLNLNLGGSGRYDKHRQKQRRKHGADRYISTRDNNIIADPI